MQILRLLLAVQRSLKLDRSANGPPCVIMLRRFLRIPQSLPYQQVFVEAGCSGLLKCSFQLAFVERGLLLLQLRLSTGVQVASGSRSIEVVATAVG